MNTSANSSPFSLSETAPELVRRFHHALTRAPGRARTGVRALRARDDDVRVRPMTLPPGRGWLVREPGWEATGYMAQL